MQKANDKSINLRAVSAIMRAHANFRLRDASFCERLCNNVDLRYASVSVSVQLLASLGVLGLALDPLIPDIERHLQNKVSQLSFTELAHSTLAIAQLGFSLFCGDFVSKLYTRADDLCRENLDNTALATERAMLATQIQAATNIWWAQASCNTKPAAQLSLADVTPQDCLTPLPPAGLLRQVVRTLQGVCVGPSDLAIYSHVGGFLADIVLKLGGRTIAIEVNGPGRFYHGTRDYTTLHALKRMALQQKFDKVIDVDFWRWPDSQRDQRSFVRLHIAGTESQPDSLT